AESPSLLLATSCAIKGSSIFADSRAECFIKSGRINWAATERSDRKYSEALDARAFSRLLVRSIGAPEIRPSSKIRQFAHIWPALVGSHSTKATQLWVPRDRAPPADRRRRPAQAA